MVKTKKLRAGIGSHRSADSKGLPPGWIRVESRSKPGAYFYAHPATKRTQTQHPGEKQISSKRPEGPRRRTTEAEEPGVSLLDVEDFEDPTEKAERLRQEAEEAEAAEAARQDMVRQQRAAKRALLKEADKKEEDGGSDEDKELVSKEELEKWKEDEERREKEEAEAERKRKEQEERRRKEEEQRRKEEERRREEEERRIEAERIALWKARTAMARKEAEFEMAMSREQQKKVESDKIQLEAEKVRQALLERKKQEFEEEKKKAEADLRRKAEAERLRRETEAKNQKNQRLQEPSDHIEAPCFDVFKGGERIGRFLLSPNQKTWTIGRCPPVDIRAGHETVSRKHAQVNRQGCFTFMQDLGSAHGTILNGQKLAKNTLERLCSGDNLRFGCSSRIYVYREPSTAIQINRGIKPVQVTIEQDIPEPELESPKHAPVLPGKAIVPDEATLGPVVTKLTEPVQEPEPSPVQVQTASTAQTVQMAQTAVVTARSPVAESETAASTELLQMSAKSANLETLPTEVKAQKEVPKKSKKSSSSSSSTSSDKKRKKKSSKSSSRRKKSSSSSTSSDKKRRDSSKKKKRKSSSTSASAEKKRKKRKSQSKRKSSSS